MERKRFSEQQIIGIQPSVSIDMMFAPEPLRAFAVARSLGRSQSAVSAAISNLKVDIGVPLFERGPRHNRLTAAGAQVPGHARRSSPRSSV